MLGPWTEVKFFDGGRNWRFETDLSVPDDYNFDNGEPNGVSVGTYCTTLDAIIGVYTSYAGGFAIDDTHCSHTYQILCECKEFN